jgi:acetoin utilization protein AcuB
MTGRTVADCLSGNIASIGAGQSLAEAAHLLHTRRVDTLIVLEGRRAVGVLGADAVADAWPSLTTSFTVAEVAARLDATRVGAVMSRDVVGVAPHTPVSEAARLMRAHDRGVLPVLVEDDVVGTLLVWDVLAVLRSAGEAKTSR